MKYQFFMKAMFYGSTNVARIRNKLKTKAPRSSLRGNDRHRKYEQENLNKKDKVNWKVLL